MIISILSAEFIKISRSLTLRGLLGSLPFFALFLAFFRTHIFRVENIISRTPPTLVSAWEHQLGNVLGLWQFFAFLFSCLFIISWQYKEHQADFFSRYRLLPYEFWQILLVRFAGFVLLYALLVFLSHLLIFLFLPPFFFFFNPQFSFSAFDGFSYVPFFVFSWLNQSVLLIPTFFFLFLFSTKISHLALNVLLLFGLIALPFSGVLPESFFLISHSLSKRMIRTMFLPTGSGLFKMHELMELYTYALAWLGGFVGIFVYFSRFFELSNR